MNTNESKHANEFRAPETIREMESADPTTTSAQAIDEMGGNPHAEPPALPPVDFRTNARGWFAEHIGEPRARSRYGADPSETESHMRRAFDAIALLFAECEPADFMGEPEADRVALVLRMLRDSLDWRLDTGALFHAFGPLAIPTSPEGFAFARRVRELSREHVKSQALECVEPDSAFGVLLRTIRAQAEHPTSGALQSATNRTTHHAPADPERISGRTGFKIGFDFHSRSFASMPKGTTLPAPLLSPALVGFLVEDPIELMSECDMCADGSADFLREFGISFEREDGSYECDSCGSETESEECGSIEQCDDFELSADMVDAIDRQGFGEKLRDYVAGGSDTETLGALLESCDDSEIRERHEPNAETGILFDSSVWAFAPDFDEIEGADDIDGSDGMRAGALLGEMVRTHTSAGVLPPIPGTLSYVPERYETHMRERSSAAIAFAWNPLAGTLETNLGGGLRLRVDARNGNRVLLVPDPARGPNSTRTLPLVVRGTEWCADAPADSGGERSALLLSIARASVTI